MKRYLKALALAAVLGVPSVTLAQEAPAAVEAPPKPNTGNLTLSAGVDFTNAYYFRGYKQEDDGLLVQPWAQLTANLCKTDNLAVNAYVATWNSVHSEHTLAESGPASWYESDVYGGIDLVMGGGFTLGLVYTHYTYPNGAFDSVGEIGVKLAYDDTATKPAGIALKPYIAAYFETNDGNGTEDSYLEAGIAPTVYTLNENSGTPISFSVPVTVGMSLDDFYTDSGGDNEFFGFGSIGLAASLPLPIPASYGNWSLTGSVTYLHLFADSVELANEGDDYKVIGKLGVSMTY